MFYCVDLYGSENYQYQLPVHHSPRINNDCVFLFYTIILIKCFITIIHNIVTV